MRKDQEVDHAKYQSRDGMDGSAECAGIVGSR